MRTFTLTGKTSVLTASYFPPIYLDKNAEYEIAFLSFEAFNSIPNVDEKNNVFKIIPFDPIIIPPGNYEFDDIVNYLNTTVNDNTTQYESVFIKLKANTNTLRSMIKSSHPVDFTYPNSINSLLGFDQEIISASQKYFSSENVINIFRVNVIRINCNIVTGAYHNDEMSHTLHEFFPHVPPGYKIIETPQNLVYLPITTNVIDHIKIEILDQDGNYVNFNSEVVTIRLHLRRI